MKIIFFLWICFILLSICFVSKVSGQGLMPNCESTISGEWYKPTIFVFIISGYGDEPMRQQLFYALKVLACQIPDFGDFKFLIFNYSSDIPYNFTMYNIEQLQKMLEQEIYHHKNWKLCTNLRKYLKDLKKFQPPPGYDFQIFLQISTKIPDPRCHLVQTYEKERIPRDMFELSVIRYTDQLLNEENAYRTLYDWDNFRYIDFQDAFVPAGLEKRAREFVEGILRDRRATIPPITTTTTELPTTTVESTTMLAFLAGEEEEGSSIWIFIIIFFIILLILLALIIFVIFMVRKKRQKPASEARLLSPVQSPDNSKSNYNSKSKSKSKSTTTVSVVSPAPSPSPSSPSPLAVVRKRSGPMMATAKQSPKEEEGEDALAFLRNKKRDDEVEKEKSTLSASITLESICDRKKKMKKPTMMMPRTDLQPTQSSPTIPKV